MKVKLRPYHADIQDVDDMVRFPRSFADWLMESGREEESREFLNRVFTYEHITPVREQEADAVIAIAEDYAPIIDNRTGEEFEGSPLNETLRVLQEVEEWDENTSGAPLSWDREADLVNRFLADSMPTVPVDLDEPEFPGVVVLVGEGESLLEVCMRTMVELAQAGYVAGAKQFLQDYKALIRWTTRNLELFQLLWSYVTLAPLDEEAARKRSRELAR